MANFNDTGNVMPDLVKDVAVTVAQQNAMERSCRFLAHGCRLFEVESGWESAMISHDQNVAVADTLLSLESALRDPGNRVIFIPLGALMTDGDIERLCQRNGVTRTLFKEVKKP